MRRLLAVTAVAALALVACSSDDPSVESPSATVAPTQGDTSTEAATDAPTADDATGTETTEATEGNGLESVMLFASLTGDAEVPGPGDPGGSGSFSGTLELLEASGELCYTLDAIGLTTEATAAHIHNGAEGESGGVAIALEPPTNGEVEACVDVDAATMASLIESPQLFYVNVHSAEFGDGAVRGQLGGR